MKICIFGAGAIGGYLAAKLAQAGANVSIIARGPHLAAIRGKGLTLIEEGQPTVTVPVTASANAAELGPQDYVIITLKAHSVPAAVPVMQPLIGPKTTFVSGVNGELAPGRDAFDLFAATFPAGTLVGAPKVRAMEIIDELEPVGRGLYGGTVGYFGAQGDMDQAITIRTLVFRGDEYSYQAGAGIVADSVAQSEYEEVLAKSGSAARALAIAGGTE